jgi:hypothetical protein
MRRGSASLRVDKADFAATAFYHVNYPNLALAADQPYVFGAWVRTAELRTGVNVVAWHAPDGPYWALPQRPQGDNPFGDTQPWGLFTSLIPARPAGGSGGVGLLLSDFQAGRLWVDDVFVMPLTLTHLAP